MIYMFVSYSDPNKPIPAEQANGVIWPEYDSTTGKYLTMTGNMSKDSVHDHFSTRSYNFWKVLIPKMMEASTHEARGRSYFSDSVKDSCSKEGNC